MRFLLHATKRAKSASTSAAKKSLLQQENLSSSENILTKAWGQQCSPNCGCVVRFESTVDNNNYITSASYQAKTLLTYVENGKRQPHYTTNHSKPLLKECSCNTLHTLCQQVTTHIQGKRVDQVMNALSGNSAAVVHASLYRQQLPTCHYSCFHLVQQALVGMICGYIPKAPSPQSYRSYLNQHYASLENDSEDGYGIDENSGISVSAAVNILDMTYDAVEEEEEEEEEQRNEDEKEEVPKRMTWEAYVDELYHQHYSDDSGVQRSA